MRRTAALMLAGGLMMGCHHEKPPTTRPVLFGAAGQGAIAVRAAAMPVQEGEPPLAYRVESNVTIRVVDQSNNHDIASAPLKAGDFVAVTQENGVMLGG